LQLSAFNAYIKQVLLCCEVLKITACIIRDQCVCVCVCVYIYIYVLCMHCTCTHKYIMDPCLRQEETNMITAA